MREPDRPFDAPWQAQVFAMTVALNEAGQLDWSRWAEALGTQLADQSEVSNDAYYSAWLAAFETVLLEDGIADAGQVSDLTAQWHAAARATPHGQPIELGNA
ncbi:nitrile hydratase accessory protein [Shimia ponticola]|uniref:nitrile hydratase accessory protein n=1 Tax=Shimia ponticola TaxID=2582893 RepID=UPI0011BF70AF|nr:nitrile hydratase accessory protein [Shimia ponticola]